MYDRARWQSAGWRPACCDGGGSPRRPPLSPDRLEAIERRAAEALDAASTTFYEANVNSQAVYRIAESRSPSPLEHLATQALAVSDGADRASVVHALVKEALRETPDTKLRLLGSSELLYSEVDRPGAEAAFRLQICPPLLGLFSALAVRGSGWWAAGAIPVVWLFISGIRNERLSNDLLVQAIEISAVTISAFANLPQVAQRLAEEAAEAG